MTPSLHWPAETLWQLLEPLRPGLSVEVVAQADSTNTRLLERARAGDAAPCLLVAERQTSGRGRHGRHWQSDAEGLGGSLTFSLGLPYAPPDWSGLSLSIGVALAEALHERVLVKWPNDLWLLDADGSGRKLGGILVETLALPQSGRHAVIGVGLNIAPQPTQGGDTAAACLRELAPGLSAAQALERLSGPLLEALRDFEQDGFAAFRDRFAARDLLLGRTVRTTQAGLEQGEAQGVDATGALLLRTPSGLHPVSSGEVSVRPC